MFEVGLKVSYGGFLDEKTTCYTARKVSKYGVFSCPFFPVFGLNTETYRVNLRIQPKYRKYGPEKTTYLDSVSKQ